MGSAVGLGLCLAIAISGCKTTRLNSSSGDDVEGSAGGMASDKEKDTGASSRQGPDGSSSMSSEDASMSQQMSQADAGAPMTGHVVATDGGATAMEVIDPAPDATVPGSHECVGCPVEETTTEADYQLELSGEAVHTFSGVVQNAIGDGEFHLESADGQSVNGVIPTSDEGEYSFTVSLFCGKQVLKCVWSNDSGTYVAVYEITATDCVDPFIRLTLTWDDKGIDFELHLVKQGGRLNDPATDCTWNTCVGTGPDWGEQGDASDDPRKDVDNTGNFGPENINYPKPADGTYTVLVEHWREGSPEADGVVTINLPGRPATAFDITDLAPHHVATVATIDWPSEIVTGIGTDYDCTANWSNGCRDVLP